MARPRQIKNAILSLREEGKTYNEIAKELEEAGINVQFYDDEYGGL